MQRAATSEDIVETVIEPSPRWKSPGFYEVWCKRRLLLVFVTRDIKARYRQTWIGIGWAFLQPALTAAFFTLFLGPALDTGTHPYFLFVFAGFVAWTFFANALVNAAGSIVASEAVLKRIHYPPLLAPLATVCGYLLDLAVATAGVVVVACFFGLPPRAGLLLLPVWVATLGLAAAGAGTLLAALSALYRDVRHLIPFLVQLWLFATPVVFLPENSALGSMANPHAVYVRWLLTTINPLNGLIAFGRAILLGDAPPWNDLAFAGGVSLILFLVACLFFRHVEDRFADIL